MVKECTVCGHIDWADDEDECPSCGNHGWNGR